MFKFIKRLLHNYEMHRKAVRSRKHIGTFEEYLAAPRWEGQSGFGIGFKLGSEYERLPTYSFEAAYALSGPEKLAKFVEISGVNPQTNGLRHHVIDENGAVRYVYELLPHCESALVQS
jgi:hypothetical protein